MKAIIKHSAAALDPCGCVLHAALCEQLLNERGLCTRADVLLSLIGACTVGAEFDSGGGFSFLIILQLKDVLSPSAQGSAAWNGAWGTWGWPGFGRPPTPGSPTTSWPFRTREGEGLADFPRASDERSLGSILFLCLVHRFQGDVTFSSSYIISDWGFYLRWTPANGRAVYLWFSTAEKW